MAVAVPREASSIAVSMPVGGRCRSSCFRTGRMKQMPGHHRRIRREDKWRAPLLCDKIASWRSYLLAGRSKRLGIRVRQGVLKCAPRCRAPWYCCSQWSAAGTALFAADHIPYCSTSPLRSGMPRCAFSTATVRDRRGQREPHSLHMARFTNSATGTRPLIGRSRRRFSLIEASAAKSGRAPSRHGHLKRLFKNLGRNHGGKCRLTVGLTGCTRHFQSDQLFG